MFIVKFTLMMYFSINSTVIYTYMLDITDLLWEEVTDTSVAMTPTPVTVAYRGGGVGVFKTPLPQNSEGPPKLCQTQPDL